MTTKEKVKVLIDEGYKPGEIALLSGVTTSRVSAIRKSLGLPSLWSVHRAAGGIGRKPKKPIKPKYDRRFCKCGLTLFGQEQSCNGCLDSIEASSGFRLRGYDDPSMPFGKRLGTAPAAVRLQDEQ